MDNRLSLFKRRIRRTKQNLINRYHAKGLYENFGQKEARKLEAYIDSSDYSETGKAMRNELNDFRRWAGEFNG